MKNSPSSITWIESLALKLVSFFLALILWITVLGFKQEETTLKIKLLPILPKGFVISNSTVSTIEFKLSGPRFLLKDVEKKVRPITPDLQNTKEKTIGFAITEDVLGDLPQGIRVLQFSPQNVIIHLEKIVTTELPIKPHLSGELKGGWKIDKIILRPKKASVEGAENVLQLQDALYTEPIDLAILKERINEMDLLIDVNEADHYKLISDKLIHATIILKKDK